MIKEYKFHEPMYSVDIRYLVGGSVPELIKKLRRRHKFSLPMSWDQECDWTEDADTTDGYQFHINAPLGCGEIFYVWVHQPTEYLLFHETFHLVGDIMNTRGIIYSYESEESFAYLGSWIYDKISSLIKKKK